jgi:DNA-directed RNA polymerase specialized sigma24 family protein
MQTEQTKEELREAQWIETMFHAANEIARYHTTNRTDAQDMAMEALEHLILIHRRYPKLRLMDNEGYARRILQNKIRDWRKVEKRRASRLQSLSEDASKPDERPVEQDRNHSMEMVFDDERIEEFEEREALMDFVKTLRPKLTKKPRLLLDATYVLDTRDPEKLVLATGIRNADAVRASLSIIQRTAKGLK